MIPLSAGLADVGEIDVNVDVAVPVLNVNARLSVYPLYEYVNV